MGQTKLYHCTNIENLNNIIQSKTFWPSFCLEHADYLDEPYDFSFAMVCFADLLGTELHTHLKKFNKDCYIQMSKEWAMRNALSTVIYYNKHSVLASVFKLLIRQILSKKNTSDISDEERYLSLMMAYFKQYEGYYWNDREGSWSKERTVFYTEREWRFVPLPQNFEAFYLPPEDFLNKQIREEKRNELIKNGYVLNFKWSDIERIGIKGSYNRSSMILKLMEVYAVPEIEARNKVTSL